jgi:ATP-dependent Clp protease ATP-binding subunit ClpA
MSSFKQYFQAVLDQAEVEAREDRSATIEPQHVLLAIAAQDGTEPQQALRDAGLDHETLKAALRREYEHSLGAAGVSLDDFDLRSTPDNERRPQLGASFKLTVERMAGAHGKQKPKPGHLLFGVLQAEVGTVPRALALAGVDRAELVERVRSTL